MSRTLLTGLVCIGSGLLGNAAAAQSGLYAVPSVGITSIHDDNLFFNTADAKADTAARVSPALELGYDSERTVLDLRYSFDAESYKEYTDLNSGMVRSFIDVTASHQLTRRIILGAEAHYTKTKTPLDLSLLAGGALQGLLVGRADAERVALNPSIDFLVSPTSSGRLAYTYTHDWLSAALESTTHTLEGEFQQQLSAASNLEYGYTYREYAFERVTAPEGPVMAFDNQYSHTPWVGLKHDFSSAIQFSGRVGPRVYEDEINPYVKLSLRHSRDTGDSELNYERNETTLLGQLGRQESETLSALFSQRLGANFELRLTPAYGRLSQEDYAVNIYRVELAARYMITPYLHIMASYDMYRQQVNFSNGMNNEVSRNVILLGFTLTYPRRSARATR